MSFTNGLGSDLASPDANGFDPTLSGGVAVKQSGKGPDIEAGSMRGSWNPGTLPLGWWWGDRTADPGLPSTYDLDNMLRIDGKARAIEQALTLPLRSADYRIVPAPGDTGQAAWLTGELERMADDIRTVIAQLAGAAVYGRTCHEIVLTVRDGRLCPEHIAPRPLSNTAVLYDAHGRPEGLAQTPPGAISPVGIPAERALIYLHNQDRDPRNGCSDMLPCYAAYMTKRRILGLWKLFLGRQAIPWATATGRTPDVNEARDLAKRVASLLSGGVAGLAQGEQVAILNAAGGAGTAFLEALQYLDVEMFASTLTQFLLLGQGKTGSFALAKSHSDLFEAGRQAQLHELETILDALARKLVAPNWGVGAPVPTFRFASLADTDLTSAVTLLQGIATATAPPKEVTGAFLGELVLKCAALLGMDPVPVQAEIMSAAEGQGSPAGQIAAGSQAAARLVAAVMPGAVTPGVVGAVPEAAPA